MGLLVGLAVIGGLFGLVVAGALFAVGKRLIDSDRQLPESAGGSSLKSVAGKVLTTLGIVGAVLILCGVFALVRSALRF